MHVTLSRVGAFKLANGTSQVDLGANLTGSVASLQLGSVNSLTLDLSTSLLLFATQIMNNGQPTWTAVAGPTHS